MPLHTYTVKENATIKDILQELFSQKTSGCADDTIPCIDKNKFVYSDTLLVFDIDNTLFRAAHMIRTDEWFTCSLEQALYQNPHDPALAKQEIIELWHAVQCMTPIVPMEGEKTAETVKKHNSLLQLLP